MILIYNFTPGWTAVRFGKKKTKLYFPQSHMVYPKLYQKWISLSALLLTSPGIEPGSLQPQCKILTTIRTSPTSSNHQITYVYAIHLSRWLTFIFLFFVSVSLLLFLTVLKLKKTTRRKVKNRKQIFQRKPQDKLIEISKHSRKKKQQPPNQNNCQFTGMRIFALPSEPNILAYVFRAHL